MLNDEELLRLVWDQYPADSWLEEFLICLKEYKKSNPLTLDQTEYVDQLITALDNFLYDLTEEINIFMDINDVPDYILRHEKWLAIQAMVAPENS